jgi:HlyD family secretion protein
MKGVSLAALTSAPAKSSRLPADPDWVSTDRWIKTGNRTVVGLLGGLVIFAWLVSISGAVVAPGTVTVENSYKTVQHLDGGIVAKILVRNGDLVDEGDVLVRLDPTAVKAQLGVTEVRYNDLSIQLARLEAERDRKADFAVPAALGIDAGDPAIAKIVAGQRALFEARRASQSGEHSVLRERIEQLSQEQVGLAAQLDAKSRESALAAKELAAVRPLFEKGYASQQRLGSLERDAARLDGEVGRLRSEVARNQSAIAEARLKLLQSDKEIMQSVVDELRKVQSALAEVDETRRAQADKLTRIDIRAPRKGRVHAVQVHTEGGVIEPAKPILQIIPAAEKLIVEAQVTPQEIDRVRRDMAASVRFPAFDARTTPKLMGTVASVSPAQLSDSQGRSYFTAQVEIPPAELKRLGTAHELKPGMPAEVYIETGTRSILSYFLKPLGDMSSRAFRER